MKTKKILTIIGGGLASAGFLPLVSVSCFDTNKSKDENSTTVEKSLSKIFNGTSSISISAKDEKSVLEALKSGNNSLKIDDLKVIFDEKENKITVMPKDGTTTYSDKIVIPFVVKPQDSHAPVQPEPGQKEEEDDEVENTMDLLKALKEAEDERKLNTPIEEANYKEWARQDAFRRKRNKEFKERKLGDEFFEFLSPNWAHNEEHEKQWAEWEKNVNTPLEEKAYQKWLLDQWYKQRAEKDFKETPISGEYLDFISPLNAADIRAEIEAEFKDPEFKKLDGEAATERITNAPVEEEFYRAWQGAEEERIYWTKLEEEFYDEKEAEILADKEMATNTIKEKEFFDEKLAEIDAEKEMMINTVIETENYEDWLNFPKTLEEAIIEEYHNSPYEKAYFDSELERLTNTPVEYEDYEDWLEFPKALAEANAEYEKFAKSDETKKWEKAEKAAEFKKKYDVDLEKLEKNSESVLDNSAAANGISKWEGVSDESRRHVTDISDSIISNSDWSREQDGNDEN
ncbi:hypothetical protein J7889_01965 [Mycoplasmopsis agalactiae]|nr:hypothetical protein [Mycoplasmopsis agalactiae]MCE6056353.1 hypothetical protein [Mycoplasmopsis agalactiae]